MRTAKARGIAQTLSFRLFYFLKPVEHSALASKTMKLFLILFLTMITCTAAELGQLKETRMTLYFQDQYGGPNASVLQVLPTSDGHLGFTKFGAIFCTDDLITEGFEVNSAAVARGQGVYVTSALDGSNTHVLVSIVFDNGEYKGSTLEVQGSSAQFERVREVAVVGGTGKFRFARGYATLETIHIELAAHLAVIQCNITILHY